MKLIVLLCLLATLTACGALRNGGGLISTKGGPSSGCVKTWENGKEVRTCH